MKKYTVMIVSFLPALAFAQQQALVYSPNPNAPLREITNINQLTNRILGIVDVALYILVAVAVIFIVWNVVVYFIKPDGSESRKESGMAIFWGIVGLFIIVSLWGLVGILVNSFGTDNNIPRDRFPTANFVTPNTSSSPSADYANEINL